jgi:menaquinone-specific isochorismate synthase
MPSSTAIAISPVAPTTRSIQAERELRVRTARAALHREWDTLTNAARIAVSVPAVSMTSVLRAVDGQAWLWLSPRGEQQVAFGLRERVTARGPMRFSDLRAFAREQPTAWPAAPSAEGVPFRIACGGTFDDAVYDTVWDGFPSAFVATPAVTLLRHDGRHVLLACARPGEDADARALADAVLDAIIDAPPIDAPVRRPLTTPIEEHAATDRATYEAMVGAITRAIAHGEVAKVVAARRLDLTFARPIEPADVLQRLAFGYPECVRFAWRWQGPDGAWRTFLGATPERLLRIEGRAIESEALAGTIAAGPLSPDETVNERALLDSAKDQQEHRLVVDHLGEVFGLLTDALHIDRIPGLRRLRNALHLRTHVRGELSAGVDAFEVLERAHPTPAVGGLPVQAAMRWIRSEEPTPRGAYAAPFGWVDAEGNAEFMVAIRCGVVCGARASLFAGAGIVADSDPAKEWDETEVKLQAVREALLGHP